MSGLCDRIEVGIASTVGWSPETLNALRASEVIGYAVACLERDAMDLARQIDLFLTPAEAFAGKDKIRGALHDRVRQMLGLGKRDALTPQERAGIEEIMREMAEQMPWSQDESALNQVWREHGRMSSDPRLGLAGVSGAIDINQLIGSGR